MQILYFFWIPPNLIYRLFSESIKEREKGNTLEIQPVKNHRKKYGWSIFSSSLIALIVKSSENLRFLIDFKRYLASVLVFYD